MPKPRKCDVVPEVLRRLEYLESLHVPTKMQQELIEKYDEIESQQQYKLEYLRSKEIEIDNIENRLQVEEQMEDNEETQSLVAEQEIMIEQLQKQQDLNLKVFKSVYQEVQSVLNLPEIDLTSNTAIFDGLKEIYLGISNIQQQ